MPRRRGADVVEIPLSWIDENPYQTRYFIKEEPASDDFVATTLQRFFGGLDPGPME